MQSPRSRQMSFDQRSISGGIFGSNPAPQKRQEVKQKRYHQSGLLADLPEIAIPQVTEFRLGDFRDTRHITPEQQRKKTNRSLF